MFTYFGEENWTKKRRNRIVNKEKERGAVVMLEYCVEKHSAALIPGGS